MTFEEIVNKIILGIEEKSEYCFENINEETVGYVWQQFKFLKSIAPANHSTESLIEDTINRIIMQMVLSEYNIPEQLIWERIFPNQSK